MCMEEATLREGATMPRASIVIPCYNAHKFIRQTLASALAQSMSDLEVICINNNSTDDTREILDEFAARDPRVRVFDEPTPGEGPARQAKLDLLDAPEDKLESHWHYQRIQDIANLPMDQLLFSHYADLKIRRDGVEEHASRVRMALDDANKRNNALSEELRACKEDLRRANSELASSRSEAERLRHDFDAVWNLASFKIGRAITSPGRHVRDGLHGTRKH